MAFDLSKLGVKQNVPRVDFRQYTGIFEGPEKFGKTEFATLYPNSIIVAAEPGYKAQVVNYKDVHTWDDFVDFVDSLSDNREEIGDAIQTIVIDTVDELYPLAAAYVIRKQSMKDKAKYNDIKDIPYGQGWTYHDAEFKRQIKRILNLGFTLLYLTHSIVKNVKPKDGEPYDTYKSTMSDRCASIVYPACDYIIRGERRKIEIDGKYVNKRVLVVKGNDESVAGNRVYFDEDIIFDSEEEAMEKFQEKFMERIKINLEKGGIKTKIEDLAAQQNAERHQEVAKFLVEEKTTRYTADSIHELLDSKLKSLAPMSETLKQTVVGILTDNLGTGNFKKITDVEKLLAAWELIKEIQ